MRNLDLTQTAIACGGTGFKAAFVHGVLTALEAHGIRAAAYGGSSLAAVPAALAATGEAETRGVAHWVDSLALLELPGNGMSDYALAQIKAALPGLRTRLFAARHAVRLCIATSSVHTVAGALETQGIRSGALGRRLQVHAERRDSVWVDEHLSSYFWDTAAPERSHLLTLDNVSDVLYASSRLLHGWQLPAEIGGFPFVDAVYTCACPALEMSALEYREVIAITGEPGPTYYDLFKTSLIPEMAWRSRIRIIRPAIDPKTLGVEDTIASEKGLVALYDHGLDRGLQFVGVQLDDVPAADPRWDWPTLDDD
jgi:hypothetical protein